MASRSTLESLILAAQEGGGGGIQTLPGIEAPRLAPGTGALRIMPGLGSLAPGLPAAPIQQGNTDVTNMIMELLGQGNPLQVPAVPGLPLPVMPEGRPGLGSMSDLPLGGSTMAGSGIPSEPSFLPSVIPGGAPPRMRGQLGDSVAGNGFSPEGPSPIARPGQVVTRPSALPSRYQRTAQRAPMSAQPDAPDLQAMPTFDGDTRGQEKAALTALIAGTLLGDGGTGVRAALGAAQGHAAGRQQVYQRDASRTAAENNAALSRYKEQGDQWTDGERAKDNAYSAMIRDDANAISQEKGADSAAIAKQRIEAQLLQTNAKLHNDLLKFGTENVRKQQETASKFLEWTYENGGTMDLGSQGLLIDRYNRMAQAAGLSPLPVPGTPYVGPDGTLRLVQALGKSPKALTADANTRLSGAQVGNINSQISDRNADNIRDEKRLTMMQNHYQTLDGLAGRKQVLAEEHDAWMKSAKAYDQWMESQDDEESGKPLTAAKVESIKDQLANAPNLIARIRLNAGDMPGTVEQGLNPNALAQWQQRRDEAEQIVGYRRKRLNEKASQIGYAFDGVGYVPKAQAPSSPGQGDVRASERNPSGNVPAPVVNLPPVNRPTATPSARATQSPTPRPRPTPRATPKPVSQMTTAEKIAEFAALGAKAGSK
jgi:hypothetical protein